FSSTSVLSGSLRSMANDEEGAGSLTITPGSTLRNENAGTASGPFSKGGLDSTSVNQGLPYVSFQYQPTCAPAFLQAWTTLGSSSFGASGRAEVIAAHSQSSVTPREPPKSDIMCLMSSLLRKSFWRPSAAELP